VEHTRQDILAAAARVFAASGFHAATMQAIAREAGFTAASLYTYFPSKDDLYEALVEDLSRGFLATFDGHAPAGLTFAQRLELLFQRQLEFVASRRPTLRLMYDQGPRRRNGEPGPAQVFLRRLRAFVAADARAALRCDADEAARLLFGLLQAALVPLVLARPGAEPRVADEAARLVDLFLNGAAARPRAR
jgi:AcrR family transcriptional regulator